jgi:D-3-phosphoglycerate dehydrogenase
MLLVLDDYLSLMSELNLNVFEADVTQQFDEKQLLEVIAQYDGVIAGDDAFSEVVLEAGAKGRLKVVSKWGVGTDSIDMQAADRHGIVVTNTPGLLGDEVADVALGYIILLARHLHRIDQAVRRGEWFKPTGHSLFGKVLGIVGAGSVGQALTTRALALGMSVVVSDPSPAAQDQSSTLGAQPMELDRLISSADYVVLACPLTVDTYHMMDARRISLMRPNAALVNVSRGRLVDEGALASALESDEIRAAALEVFEDEPLGPENPLCSFDQVILGSHNSSNTDEAVRRVTSAAIDNLATALSQWQART